MPPQAKQFITFSAHGVPDVTVLLNETPAQITGGYGGWTVESRDRRVGLTQWNGKDPLRMQIALLFDGVRKGEGQEIPISRLSRMALPPTGGGEPPIVNIDAPGVPLPGPIDWVIESLNWGTNTIWDFGQDGSMVRLRQDCIVNLLQYVDEDRAAFKNIAPGTRAKTGKSKAGWPKTYIVKTGDTLSKIAARKDMYHDSKLWKKIATANNIRDPRSIKVGQRLRIPAP